MILTKPISLPFLFLRVLLAPGVVLPAKCSLNLLSAGPVPRHEVRKLLELLILVLHGGRAQRERSDELLEHQRSLLHL